MESLKFSELSECRTIIARMRNLLKERGISIPPSIQEETKTQLENYKRYLNTRIDSRKRELEEDLESVKRTSELLREKEDYETADSLKKLKNHINREIQELSALDGEEVLEDPEWK